MDGRERDRSIRRTALGAGRVLRLARARIGPHWQRPGLLDLRRWVFGGGSSAVGRDRIGCDGSASGYRRVESTGIRVQTGMAGEMRRRSCEVCSKFHDQGNPDSESHAE